jgi:hypothetical protein
MSNIEGLFHSRCACSLNNPFLLEAIGTGQFPAGLTTTTLQRLCPTSCHFHVAKAPCSCNLLRDAHRPGLRVRHTLVQYIGRVYRISQISGLSLVLFTLPSRTPGPTISTRDPRHQSRAVSSSSSLNDTKGCTLVLARGHLELGADLPISAQLRPHFLPSFPLANLHLDLSCLVICLLLRNLRRKASRCHGPGTA